MNRRFQALLGTTVRQRRARAATLLAGVVAVPLAVAGLVSGALGGVDDRLDEIPAIVVNEDEMITTTNPDGTEQPVLAGRLLVTELTGPETAGFSWTISNADEAAEQLADGAAYAVLTIPSDFSASITSLSGAEPAQAQLDIRTDDAHGYLAGSVAQSVGDAMTSAFGREITAQYLEGFYSNLAGMAGGMQDAADGAAQLSSGAGSLAGGLGELSGGLSQAAGGAADAADGAHAYADGVAQYTNGVDGIAAGLGALDEGAGGLDQLSDNWERFADGVTAGVDQAHGFVDPVVSDYDAFIVDYDAFIAAHPELVDQFPVLDEARATLGDARSAIGEVTTQLDALSDGGQALAAATRTAIDDTQAGIEGLAAGTAELAGGSQGLRDGATGLADGVDELAGGLGQLASGATDAATGAGQLEGGAVELADGLATGAEQAGVLGDLDAEKTAAVVSQPVSVDAARDNEISGAGEVIAMLFAPVGLWIGALALFLAFRPFGREALRSTASTGGLVQRTLARAGLIGLAQAGAIALLLHVAMGVPWNLLPQTLAFSALLALVFTALHAFLTAWLGRAGAIVSIVLVALQLAASGGLYPVELLSGPFQAISPLLPLTWAVQGMQAIVAGSGAASVVGASAVLALFGVAGAALTALVVGRRRGIRSIGFAATAAG